MFLTAFALFALVLEYNCDSTDGIHDSLFGVTVYFGNCPSQSRKVVQAVDSSFVCRKGSTFYCEEYCAKRFNKEDEQVMGGRCLQSIKEYKFSVRLRWIWCHMCKGPGASDTKCIEDVNSEVLPEDTGNPLCKLQSHKTCNEKCLSTYINAEKGLCRPKYGEKYECVCKTCGPAERFNLGLSGVLGTVDCRGIAPPLPLACVIGDWSPWSDCSAECGGGHGVRSRTRDVVMNDPRAVCPGMVQCDTCNAQPCVTLAPAWQNDCQYSVWSPFSLCTVGCNQVGTQHRSRVLENGDVIECNETFECRLCEDCEGPNQERTNMSVTPPSQQEQRTTQAQSSDRSRLRVTLVHLPVARSKQIDLCPIPELHAPLFPLACIEACVEAFRHHPVSGGICELKSDGMGSFFSSCICALCNTFGALITINNLTITQGDYPRCVHGSWNDWSFCTARCNGGTRRRKRSLMTGDKNVCTDVMQYRSCSQPPCRIDCVVTKWSDWNNCNATCGTGKQSRRRQMVVPPLYGGKCNRDTIQHRSCDAGYVC